MHQNEVGTSAREAAVNTLAVVGFIALVGAGIWLAIYSTRFVPAAVDRIGTAAVYLGSLFTPSKDEDPGVTVVPTETATTTIPFGTATTTPATPEPEPAVPPKPAPKPAVTPAPGVTTTTTVQIDGTATPAALYGLPDLTIRVTAVGYLNTSSVDSFIEASRVPSGKRPAVKFTVGNAGTNRTGAWRLEAKIPTRRAFTYTSTAQESLQPGDTVDYTLGFDQADRGTDQTITLTLDSRDQVDESNESNNTARANVTVL